MKEMSDIEKIKEWAKQKAEKYEEESYKAVSDSFAINRSSRADAFREMIKYLDGLK